MLIKNVEIVNFKSFKSLQKINVGNKNVIIGKNGSGKSNLLTAISYIFNPDLLSKDNLDISYNGNEEDTSISVEIDNSDRRFLLPNRFVIQLIRTPHKLEFMLNNSIINKEELKGLYENAGLTKQSFVAQGKINEIAMMSNVERYNLISNIAGADRFEESKSLALKFLNEESQEKIDSLIEKIEMKMRITEDYKNKAEEYDRLYKIKLEKEYEIMCHDLDDLNVEINKIEIGTNKLNNGSYSTDFVGDENLAELELKNCVDEINQKRHEIEDATAFINKFDRNIIDELQNKIKARDNTYSGIENNSNIHNPYIEKIHLLQSKKNIASENLKEAKEKEREKYIELKALEYFEASGKKKEDIGILESELSKIKEKINKAKNLNSQLNEPKRNVQELTRNKKELFIKEKKVKDQLKKLREEEKNLENKILYLGKQHINIYDRIKNREGVHGSIYSLFTVPDKLIDAYEAVTRNSLFWIVVSNEDVATHLIEEINGVVTFVALNRIIKTVDTELSHPSYKQNNPSFSNSSNLYKLSDQIDCLPEYRSLLNMICKDYYVCDDLKNAIGFSEKYNVSVVTLEGDLCNKNGIITGGYEKTNHVLRDLKNCKTQITNCERIINETENEIRLLGNIVGFESDDNNGNRALDDLLAVGQYLKMKIKFMKNKQISIPDILHLKSEYSKIQKQIPIFKLELSSLENQLERTLDKKDKIDHICEKLVFICNNEKKLKELQMQEKKFLDFIYSNKQNVPKDNFLIQRKHMLIDKRTNLMMKMGLSDFNAIKITAPREILMDEIKEVNKELKKYAGFSKREIHEDQRLELKNRLEDLKNSKLKIFEFINILDQKKEETIKLTFSMISDNYSYLYRMITGDNSKLILVNSSENKDFNENGIVIEINNKIADVNSMSGGQKTIMALCLIFAIQKNDPSPFYVFDEIDANLDPVYCEKLYEIIYNSQSQYFITSFKTQSIMSADKHFGVVTRNKESFVDEIDANLAYESLNV